MTNWLSKPRFNFAVLVASILTAIGGTWVIHQELSAIHEDVAALKVQVSLIATYADVGELQKRQADLERRFAMFTAHAHEEP